MKAFQESIFHGDREAELRKSDIYLALEGCELLFAVDLPVCEILVAKKGADMVEHLRGLICDGQYHRG